MTTDDCRVEQANERVVRAIKQTDERVAQDFPPFFGFEILRISERNKRKCQMDLDYIWTDNLKHKQNDKTWEDALWAKMEKTQTK